MPFEINPNRENPLRDDEKSVLVEETGELLAFPATMSDDEIQHVVDQDIYSKPSNWKPGYYESTIRPNLDAGKVNMFNPGFLVNAEAFGKSALQSATFGIYKPSKDEQEKFQKYSSVSSMAGQFTGFVLPAAGLSALNGLVAARVAAVPAIAGLLTKAGAAATRTMGAANAAKAGQIASSALSAGAVAGEYTGISDVVNEVQSGKSVDEFDYEKIGTHILKEFSIWGLVGGATGAIAKPLVGMSGIEAGGQIAKELAISGGSMYAISKAGGADDKDATLAAGLAMVFHSLSFPDKIAERQLKIEQTRELLTNYMRAKNGVMDENIAIKGAQEIVDFEAANVLSTKALSPKDLETAQTQPLRIIEKDAELTKELVKNLAEKVIDPESGAKFPDKESPAAKSPGDPMLNKSGEMALPGVDFTEPAREGFYQQTINRFQSIENVVDRARKLGADIPASQDAGLSATRYLSSANQAEAMLNYGPYKINKKGNVEKTGEGLRNIIREYDTANLVDPKGKEKDLNDYLIARRTVEDLQRPKEKGGSENIASPEQVETAKKTLTDLQTKYGQSIGLLEDTAQRIYEYQRQVLNTLVDSGILSSEKYNAIISQNKNYIPFDRVFEQEKTTALPVNKGRFSGMKNPVKRIKGSEREIHDPIESIIKNTYKIVDAASRNKVFNDLYSLKDIKELGINPVQGKMVPVEVTAKETGTTDITIFRPSPYKPSGNVLEGFIDGKRTFMEVPENIYKSAMGLNEQSSSLLTKILSKPASLLRFGATSTPEFMLRNPIRDQWTALMNTQVGFKMFVDPISSLSDILGKSEVYNDWIRAGGAYAGFVELSRPSLGKELNKLRGKKSSPITLLTTLLTFPQEISAIMEQATRVGVFKAGKRKGMSDIEAAKQSREATIDFNRRGSQTKDLNAMIAFFNASIQSVDKLARAAAKDPAGFTTKGLATITIPSVLLYLANRKDPEYKEIPRWEKDLFWVFHVGKHWYKVPKPFSYGQIFGSLPERFLEYLDTRDPESIEDLKKTLYNSVSPFSDDPVASLLPTGIKPIIENMTNWSFFRDAAIVPEGREDLIPEEQFAKYTSETAKAIGKVLHLSPAHIENLIQGYLAGTGKYAVEGSDLLGRTLAQAAGIENKEKRPTELSDIIGVKGFVAKDPVGNQSQSVKRFYKIREELLPIEKTVKRLKKEGRSGESIILADKNKVKLSFVNKVENIHNHFMDHNKKVENVIKDKELPDDVKRRRIRELEEQKTKMASEFIQEYNEAIKK